MLLSYPKKVFAVLVLLLSSVTGFAQLTANFTASSTTGCNPMVVQFTNTSTGSPTSYFWEFGNSITSTLQNPSTTYTNPGSYTVKLTVTNASGGTNTKTVTNYITVYDPPTVNFTVDDTAGCPPHTAHFTSQVTLNSPGAGNYFWTFGTGSTVVSQNPTFTFPDPGYFTVTHVVVNGAGCTTTHQKPAYIHVYEPPVADFSAFQVLCGPGPVQFANTTTGSGPFTYSWDFGDGGNSTIQTPTHTYANLGAYTVKLIVTDANGCKDTMIKTNYITVVPNQAFFTAPTSACEDEPLTFTNTTPATIYANWDFGDGTPNDTNQTVTHIYTLPGTYTLSLSVNNGTCIVYKSQTITIHPKPTIGFSANTLTPCPAPVTIQFTNSTTNGATYAWNFGDGGTSTAVNPTHVYLQNGFFDVSLVVTSPFGCKDSVYIQDYVKIFPSILNIEVTPGDGCIPLTDTFTANLASFMASVGGSIAYPASITSYSWAFGDGTYSTLAHPIHTYNAVGSYTVSLHVTTSNGCTDSASITVNAGTPPFPNFYAIPTTTCVDMPVTFINTSTNALTYQWYFGDGLGSAATSPVHNYNQPGLYTVTLVANNNGCIDTLVMPDYIKINFPKAQFATAYQCDTLTKVAFSNNSLGYNHSLWDFGDGTTSTVTSPIHVYSAIGSYTVTLVVYNDTSGCTDTATGTVDMFDPSPAFTANDTAVCPEAEVIFMASFPGSQFISRYDWIFDGFLVDDTTSLIIWPYYSPGYHDVTLITKDAHGCWDTIVKNDYIIVGHPTVNFTANNVNICAPGTVTFTNTSMLPAGTTIASSTWNFGNGQIVTLTPGMTATTTYTALGNYDVELVVTDNIGCSDSLEKPAYVHVHDPTANFSVNNTNACLGVPLPFISVSMGVNLTYQWDFGDGGTSTDPIPQHPYMQTGTYTVKLIVVDAYGCSDTIIKPNYISVWNNPVASFSLSDTFRICPPLFVQATNTSTTNCVYNWAMGDGTTNVAVNPSHIYVDPGQYTVRLIAINNYGCRDTAYKQVKILGYDGVITYAPLIGCAPLTVNYNANVQNVPGLVWDFADGTTLATTDTFATHTYLEPGPYVPRLIMTDNSGCASTSYGLDTIKVDGVYSGFTFSPYPACDSGTLHFVDTSKGAYSTVVSRSWEFHSGMTSTSATPSHFYPAPGDYIIKLYTTTSTGCLDTLIDTLTFYPLPIISAGDDTTVCVGDSATLMPSGGVSYEWAPAATLSCVNCTNPHAGPLVPTDYTVIGTDIHGCKNKDTVRVELKTKTEAEVEAGGEICNGEKFQLQVNGAHNYDWLPPGSLDNPNSDHPLASPDTTVTYIVISREGSCTPDTDYVTVVVHPRPEVDAGPDQTIIAGDVAYIDATGTNVFRWEWFPYESLSCADCEDPEATPKRTTTYTVNVYTDFGCRDSDMVTIHVICKESQVFMPNTFTPNGDGQNDIFYPRGKGIEIIRSFRIYNRWGELVFEKREMDTNELNNGWDGTYKGKELAPDVFLYIVDAICDTGEPVTWKGDINLIR